ncbi:hypothetical protein R3X27_00600 [Tropicimonas sp. TH_r6]|uniref:hypothetical protein n=1 Tax=Tropicimonas sp. TH_r6 TaxID=3082085 RepID=UPI002955CD9B|nr:hypothetical protein [Tropicimonas sp. TH_r6]MDV7141170.1 hypothetical protein [Tropicimonas sp. TH_r6]
MVRTRQISRWLAGLALAWLLPALAAAEPVEAHFVVHDRAVTPPLQPFATTIGAIGNGAALMPNGGFEPMILRDMFMATEDAPDRVIAPPHRLTNYDSWRPGMLDGAEVEILRIENGSFRSVRLDRVAQGGHHASGWVRMFGDKVVAPDRSGITVSLPAWFRSDVPVYFTLRSVDSRGGFSAPAQAVSVQWPGPPDRKVTPADLIDVKTLGTEQGLLPSPDTLSARLDSDGNIRLDWPPVAGAQGYAIYRSDRPPSEHDGYFLQLAGTGPAIRAGDLVILRARRLRADRTRLLSHRVWGGGATARDFLPPLLSRWSDDPDGGNWHLVRHPRGTPLPDPGETHLRVQLGFGQEFRTGRRNHSGLAQSWYPVLEPGRMYRFEVWLRGEALRPVTFELTGFHTKLKGGALGRYLFRVTPDWKLFSGTFSVPVAHPGKEAGRMQLRLTGPGLFDIDNFRVYADDAPYLSLPPEDAARLAGSGMSLLRTHSLVKTGRASYDLTQLTNPGGAINGTGGGNTLPQLLNEMARLGMDPWLQIEPHLSAAEWLGLADFLAEPRRTGAFGKILLEIGNETWNPLFAPWTFPKMRDAGTGRRYSPGETYGLYQEYVLSILRQSPNWEQLAPKLVPVIGGRAGLGDWAGFNYGQDAAQHSPSTAILTHAGYIGGWESGEGPVRPDPAGLSRVLTHVLQAGIPQAKRQRDAATRIARSRGTPLVHGTYEAGPGYAMNGLNGRHMTDAQSDLQQRAMKSIAAGTATLDSFLARARHGEGVQTYFSYGQGSHWASHLPWQQGGDPLPSWELLTLFNRVGLGKMLDIETRTVPRRSLPHDRGRIAVPDAPLLAAYATRSPGRVTLILISRRVPDQVNPQDDGTTSVTVALPFSEARKVTRYWLEGPWNGHDLDGDAVRLRSEQRAVHESLPQLQISSLPPGKAEIYVFETFDNDRASDAALPGTDR